MFFLLFVAELSYAVAVLAFVARVTWLLGAAPSHEIQKALPVTGCWLLESQVTPSLGSQQLPVTPVAPSHEIQKGVAGYRLLVTRVSGLKGLLVSSQSYSFVPNG